MTRQTPFRPALRGLLALSAVAVLAMALPVAAQVYEWKDADGVTHYSDSPPAGQNYQNRSIKTPLASPAKTAEAGPAESNPCTDARANLELLDGDQTVGVDNDGDGKPDVAMDADQRTAQKQLAEAAIKVHCTPASGEGKD